MTTIAWFRRDLRLADNPAWAAATTEADDVVPVFVIDPTLWDRVSPARRDLLAANLRRLDEGLAHRGGRLHVARGDPVRLLPELSRRFGGAPVHANGDHSPYAARRDEAVAASVDLRLHDGTWVHPPGSVLTAQGERYRVFTPYYRSWSARTVPFPAEAGEARVLGDPGEGVPDAGLPAIPAGERAAMDRLTGFLARVDRYPDERDRPDLDSTSRLSIDLKFGTISPSHVVRTVGTDTEGRRAFVRQLAWRDFHADILLDAPHIVDQPLRPEYRGISWNDDDAGFEAWARGLTGFPLVDAGMRQLAGEGWIHNRVRMVVASFLVKDLLIDWRRGERFLRRHLLDGDTAQNVGNWQWAAGTGADAAPYFRIFNPVSQSRRFDPNGAYIRRWVPELGRLDAPAVHTPWEAGPLELAAAGVVLGETYPDPIVDHATAREQALDRYKRALGRL